MNAKKLTAVVLLMVLTVGAWAQDTLSVQNLKREGSQAFKEEKFEEALAKFEEAIAASEKQGQVDAVAIFKAGMAAYKADKHDKAIGYFQTAIEKDEDKCKAYNYLAAIYDKQENGEKEIETLKTAINNCPAEKGKFEKKLAKRYLRMGGDKYNQAAKTQTAAVKMPVNSPQQQAAMAKAKAEFEASLAELELSYALDPQNKNLLKMLSTVYTNLDQKDKAAQIQSELDTLGK